MSTAKEVEGVSVGSVEQQLHRLRSSPLFSHSRRYPLFLEYVVRKTLNGLSDELKERTVGVEAFGRPPGYDLNTDPIVRVTAGEVRKRLAQYYYEPEHHRELRIELRPGSYVPEFRSPPEYDGMSDSHPAELELLAPSIPALSLEAHPAVIPVELDQNALTRAGRAAQRWKNIAIASLSALLVLCLGGSLMLIHRPSAIDLFWQPVVEANGAVLISVGSVVAMVNSNAVAPPPSSVSGHPLSVDPIAVSDATALSSIQQVLSIRSKTSTLESSTGTSFSDLQHGPVVLISGFNNQWTMRITDPLRFHFLRTSTDEYTIQDRQNPSERWGINTADPFFKMTSDYGLVARFHDPTTEQIVVVAAGIGENGTLAASRVLTDEKLLAELRQGKILPKPGQNFEAVVETQIIDGKPGPPRILATYTW